MALDPAQESQRIISETPYALLQPTPALYNGFLQLAKSFLDSLANDVTNVQTERQQHARSSRKRKRGNIRDVEDKEEVLRMRKVYVEGFDIDQVWQQAKKVLDAAATEIERDIPRDDNTASESGEEEAKARHSRTKVVRFDEDGSEVEDVGEDSLEGSGMDSQDDEQDRLMDGMSASDEDMSEAGLDLEDEDAIDREHTPLSETSDDEGQREVLVKDKFGLNDGFFSIDNFNKQSQFLENQDARGDPNDGAASDEEDIDWAADPLATGSLPATRNKRNTIGKPSVGQDLEVDGEFDDEDDQADDDDDDDEEDGPTFGNVDLFAAEGASEDEEAVNNDDDLLGGDFANTNNVLYGDFFAPPAKAQSKQKKNRANRTKAPLQNGTLKSKDNDEPENYDEDIQRTMSGVHRDLFEDDLSAGSEEEKPNGTRNAGPNSKLSTHERAQATLRAEIRKLEAANVAAKPWYLSGEAVAATRPVNSLLEEDLEFERAGKPVPVITEEVNESIEALIKRRVLAREFDEVIRRRPTDLATGADPRRGRIREELADTKPTKGLAEEYEQEHLKRTDPNFVDTRTEATKQVHREIEGLWAKVSAQLDALSNWHYKPKPPVASLEVRVNAPTISLEDARPSAGGEVGQATLLAPQEVYRPGEEGRREGEVLTTGGISVAKEEDSREQKRRRRAREKQRAKKAGANESAAAAAAPSTNVEGTVVAKGRKAARNEVVSQLKKGGAKIIDRKGDLRDVEGRTVKDSVLSTGAAAYRL